MHRYILEPYNGRESRYACPNCRHRRGTFTRYIDTVTKEHLADHVGKCDRLDGCGYHYPPRDYFAATPAARPRAAVMETAKRFDVLPRHYVDDTATAYERNNFIHFVAKCFGQNNAEHLARRYNIGTSKHWPGATIFWQIDVNDRVRTGKIMLYNRTDGHRVKEPFNHVTWAHTLLIRKSESPKVGKNNLSDLRGLPDFRTQIKQCFFGEHLLQTDPFKTVAVVESEKTAVICSFIDPRYIWLASGSLEGINYDKCRVLAERSVILYPDVNGYQKWRQKAREMNLRFPAARFSVDATLERTANWYERRNGIDIADRWIEQLTFKP